MHYYSFNIPDWTVATAHLSLEEQAVYFRLVNHYYDTEQPIPLETQSVIRRLRLTSHEKVLESVLAEFFTKTEKGFVNSRCERELKEYRKLVKKNRENGAKGGRPKKNKDLPAGEEKPTGNPLGTQSQPTGNPPINHSLLPIKPMTKGFVKPTLDELIAGFNGRVADPSREAEKFLNHYESNGWKVGSNKMKSWPHAVNKWVSNCMDRITPAKPTALDKLTDRSWSEGMTQ
jgi:uncharacterized protein YdaU (DUF1376 family)